jgi:tetratricopeptide (TPR) repeat protein
VVLQNKVPVADWKAYKKFADAAGVGNEVFVQLRHAGGEKGEVATSSAAGNTDAQLQAIYSQLENAFQYGEVSKMESLLKQMKEINPKAPRLMAWEASVAILHHHFEEAIEDNRKELALYPAEYDRYGAIAWIQTQQKDRAGIEATLRDWAKANEVDPQPLVQLSQLLTAEGKLADGVQAAKDAAARAPEGSEKHGEVLLLLGNAQMKAGMKDDARATLLDVLQKTDDPVLMNDAAFELADAGQELPLDEAKEHAAIDRLTEETRSWTLDESPAVLKQKTQLLLAAWDTMGWILYKEGKPGEAVSYLEAARMGRADPVVTEHLSKARAALTQADAKSAADPDAGKSEQQLRTISLGASGGLRGVAEYKLLLSHGQIERAELTGDDKLEGSDALLKRAKLRQFFPQGSDAKLVRQGVINCVAGRCDLVLEP